MSTFRGELLNVYRERSQAFVQGQALAADGYELNASGWRDLRELWRRVGGDVAELDAIDAVHLAAVKANVLRMR